MIAIVMIALRLLSAAGLIAGEMNLRKFSNHSSHRVISLAIVRDTRGSRASKCLNIKIKY